MKILNVNSALDPIAGGGAAERTLQVSRALVEAGMDCSIMTTTVGFSDENIPAFAGGRIIAYQCLLKRFYVPLVSYKKIQKEVKSADIVHLMGHWSALNTLVYLAARQIKKPYVVCPAGALPIYGRSKVIKKLYNWIIGKSIIRNASAWIAITDSERCQFENYGVPRDSVIIIPNGVNPDDFSVRSPEKFITKYEFNGEPFILFLGRLNTIKGPDMLLEAFYRGRCLWPEWHLVFAGPDGGLLSSLRKSAAEQSHVHFIGPISGTEKSAAYHAAQLLVIPSRQEAMSIVVLEAGISGTPGLLTDQCGFDEVSAIGGGKIVSATVEGIQAGLTEILVDKMSLIEKGGKLKNLVQHNYTWTAVIRKYVNLYHRLA